jgi:molecular chaperone GrpE
MKKKTDDFIELEKKEVDEWKNKYLRALADYQNLERRTREEKEEVRRYAAEIILGRILPVVDTFAKVKEHVKDIGFELAYKELLAVLQEQGVEHIEVLEKEFNPHEMECIEVVDGKDNIVMEETLPGYKIHGKILRVANVKVGKQKI